MSGHGGHRTGSGRKRIYTSQKHCLQVWQRGHRRISLDYIIYSSWEAAKIKCGYKTDSQFAGHLLSLEWRRRQNYPAISTAKRKTRSDGEDGATPAKRSRHLEGPPVTSTPVKSVPVSIESPNLTVESISDTSDVDVTGITEFSVNDSTYHIAGDSVIITSDGDKYQDSDDSISDYQSSDEEEIVDRSINLVLMDALHDLREDSHHAGDSDSLSISDVSDIDDMENSVHMEENDYENELQVEDSESDYGEPNQSLFDETQQSDPTSTWPQPSTPSYVPQPSTPLSVPQPSTPLSVLQPMAPPSVPQPRAPSSVPQSREPPCVPQPSPPPSVPQPRAPSPVPQPSTPSSVPQSSALGLPNASSSVPRQTASTPVSQQSSSTASSGKEQNYPKLSRLEEQENFKEELSTVRQTKVICSLDLLLNVFKNCQHPGCTNSTTTKHHLNGPTAVISWSCPKGHKGTFCSSKDQNDVYSNNLQVGASILLSGNNFAKIQKFAQFLGLSFISDSTFYRMQRLYLIPAVNEWWSWQREQLLQEFLDKDVIVCGDGQCDSPGFTAKNLCYFLMELVSGYILEVEVRDKRHVGLVSVNMEKQALQNALQRLRSSLNIVEVVTDASSSIKKMLADNFTTIFHSLDVWHKSKSIRKCLAKVGHLKNMDKIQAWSEKIVLHFWHSASSCKSTETTSDEEALEKMKSTWLGLLHHVCDEYEWVGGKCDHEELEEHSLPWFDRGDKDYEALQKIILEPQLLASFKFYVRFRHTGSLECANSLSLVYTPKRCSYSYKAYKQSLTKVVDTSITQSRFLNYLTPTI